MSETFRGVPKASRERESSTALKRSRSLLKGTFQKHAAEGVEGSASHPESGTERLGVGNTLTFSFPAKLESLANKREHWAARAKRAKAQREQAYWQTFAAMQRWPAIDLPMAITVTRIAPKRLDTDNLAISAKHVRDGIAKALGLDDGHPGIDWRYAQRREGVRQYAVEIRIESALGAGRET